MTLWLALAIASQFITAGAVLIDKYVLLNKGTIGKPIVYAFYVSILSGFVLVLVPFGVISTPSLLVLKLSFGAAVAYIISLLLLYTALKEGQPSDVMPVVGAFTAIFTYMLSMFFLNTDLPPSFALAFLLLIVGSLLISHFRFTFKQFMHIVFAGLLFAASTILIKFVFMNTTFIDGFFWSRMANVIGALLLLLIPGTLYAIRTGRKHATHNTKALVLGNKAVNGVAFIMTLYALHLGSATIVNALSGLQFVFLFLFAYVLAHLHPKIFHGEVRPHDFPHKIIGTLFIVAGLAAIVAFGTT